MQWVVFPGNIVIISTEFSNTFNESKYFRNKTPTLPLILAFLSLRFHYKYVPSTALKQKKKKHKAVYFLKFIFFVLTKLSKLLFVCYIFYLYSHLHSILVEYFTCMKSQY